MDASRSDMEDKMYSQECKRLMKEEIEAEVDRQISEYPINVKINGELVDCSDIKIDGGEIEINFRTPFYFPGTETKALITQSKDGLQVKYDELIMAVERKFFGETRHDTALKYINQAENMDCARSNTTKINKHKG